MKKIRRHPHLLELNALIFLRRLQKKYKSHFSLAEIPQEEWRVIAAEGFDFVWLMGLWKRSPGARQCALQDPALREEYGKVLGDWKEEDVPGSPYAIFDYILEPQLGLPENLKVLQQNLKKAGLHLIADYVPNHLALDHGLTLTHPEIFVQAPEAEALASGLFFKTQRNLFLAHGKDPFFSPWRDTVQINYFSPKARQWTVETILEIAEIADGVRCDMSMLGIQRIFEKTWGSFLKDPRPQTEFWAEVILKVKAKHPDFIFMAEAYWDLEWELQQMGFDYTYDKKLYDRLLHAPAGEVRGHLNAESEFQNKSVRFIENHDEPRAAHSFGAERSKAAAAAAFTIPGLRFIHDGQRAGKEIHLTVQLGRETEEKTNLELEAFYQKLLLYINKKALHEGVWRQNFPVTAGFGDGSFENLLSWSWVLGREICLVVINDSSKRAQGKILFLPEGAGLPKGPRAVLEDFLTGEKYEWSWAELKEKGLYVDLKPWQIHLFHFNI